MPGRLGEKTQYTDFIPTLVIRDLTENTARSKYTKVMQAHHVKTSQMNDLNDITYTQDQITEQIHQKEQYDQLKGKIMVYLVIGGTTVVIIVLINIAIVWLIHKRQSKPDMETQLFGSLVYSKHQWIQTPEQPMEATAPQLDTLPTIPEEESVASTFIYPKLKIILNTENLTCFFFFLESQRTFILEGRDVVNPEIKI
jgi:hypothetical protein